MGMKVAFFLFFLFTRLIFLAGGLQVFSTGGYQGIVDDNGAVIIPAVYEHLGWSDGSNAIQEELIGYKEKGKWGLISIEDKKVTGAKYTILRPFSENYFEAGVTGRFSNLIFRGLIDRKANTKVSFRYFSIEPIGDDRLLVSEYIDRELKYGIYTYENERVIPMDYHGIQMVGSLFQAQNHTRKIQLFDRYGKPLLNQWIDEIHHTAEGYLLKDEGNFGFLSESGVLIHPIRYKAIHGRDEPESFTTWQMRHLSGEDTREVLADSIIYHPQDDVLIAHLNDVTHILGASDDLFQDQQHQLKYVGNGFIVAQNVVLDTWGIYKTNGTEIISGYDSIAVDENYFYAQNEKGWDIFNFFGRKINNRAFDQIGFSNQANIAVKKNGYWGWIDFQGNKLLDYKYDQVFPLSKPDHFAARYLDSWGVSTTQGTWLIMPEYDTVMACADYYIAKKALASHIYAGDTLIARLPYQVEDMGFIRLKQDSTYGLVTRSGVVVDPEYDQIEFISGYYELRSGDEVGLIDSKGRIILKPEDKIQDVLNYSEGYFMIRKDDKYGFVDENGKLRVANRYDNASPYQDGLAPVSLLGKWGYIDKAETLVIQPYYKYSSTFQNGYAIVQIGKNFGLIDRTGKEVIGPEWKRIDRLSTGNYLVTDWDDKVGLANSEGIFIVRPAFDEIQDTDRELVIASRSGKKGVLDYKGFTRVSLIYDEVMIQGDYLLLLKNRN